MEIEHFSSTSTAIYAIDLGDTRERGRAKAASCSIAASQLDVTAALVAVDSRHRWTVDRRHRRRPSRHEAADVPPEARARRACQSEHRAACLGARHRIPDAGRCHRRSHRRSDRSGNRRPVLGGIDRRRVGECGAHRGTRLSRSGVRSRDVDAGQPARGRRASGCRVGTVPRDSWMLIDRATVNNRAPASGVEQFGLLSVSQKHEAEDPGAHGDVQHGAYGDGVQLERTRRHVVDAQRDAGDPLRRNRWRVHESELLHARALVVAGWRRIRLRADDQRQHVRQPDSSCPLCRTI
jgi:hypothetical protein